MKYETRLEMLKLSDIVAAPYNPREDIESGSDEYKALRRSIELNGMVEPPVVHSTICAALVVISALWSSGTWDGKKCSAPSSTSRTKARR